MSIRSEAKAIAYALKNLGFKGNVTEEENENGELEKVIFEVFTSDYYKVLFGDNGFTILFKNGGKIRYLKSTGIVTFLLPNGDKLEFNDLDITGWVYGNNLELRIVIPKNVGEEE